MAARSNALRIGERTLKEAARAAGVDYATARWRLKKGWPIERVLGPVETPLLDMFDDAYVPEPNSGCWIWLRGTTKAGYGQVSLNGRVVYAHRVAYERAHGHIPPFLHVLHRCDTPTCVNPDHLFVGSDKDNHQDKAKKGRVYNAKFTPEQVRGIRADPRLHRLIAKDYGVNKGRIQKIKARTIYSHLEDTP